MEPEDVGGGPPVVLRVPYAGLAAVAGPLLRRLARGDVVLVLGPPGRPDLAVLDVLARVVLAARRAGAGRLVVRERGTSGPGGGPGDGPGLAGLAALCGLAGAVGPAGAGGPVDPGSSAEAGGQPEPVEQVAAEEVVQVPDAPA